MVNCIFISPLVLDVDSMEIEQYQSIRLFKKENPDAKKKINLFTLIIKM